MIVAIVYSTELIPLSPFDFNATFHKPDHFTSGDNDWEPDLKWQTFWWEGINFGVKFENKGEVDTPKVAITVYASQQPTPQVINSLINEIKYRYNFNLDISAFYYQFSKDKDLGPIINRWNGMRPGHPSSLYEYLIIGIMLQNATVRRSVQMFKTLLERYGTLLDYDGKQLWCFWAPGALQIITEDELRSLKVGYRAKSIKRTDDCFASNLINEMNLRDVTREIQMSELLKLYGVGPATVWYLLFDVFHHWDFFDHISPWEQKIYSKLFFDQEPDNPVPVEKLLSHFEKYGDFRQLAVHYIWEDLWWKRKNESIPWLEKLIRI
jgi:3-methyladenine DNA glycosylase/8-oxoguanine DNA glycosylase